MNIALYSINTLVALFMSYIWSSNDRNNILIKMAFSVMAFFNAFYLWIALTAL